MSRVERPTVTAMDLHVALLADRHDVRLDIKPGRRDGRAWRAQRLVEIGPVKSTISYATALHEIGHIVGRGAGGGPRLHREAAAWAWAIEHALPGSIDDRFIRSVRRCLWTYFRWAVRRCNLSESEVDELIGANEADGSMWVDVEGLRAIAPKGAPIVPPPGDIFWPLLLGDPADWMDEL